MPWLRPVAAVVLAVGWLLLWRARRPGAIAWAAALPLGVALVWPWILGADVPLGVDGCQDPVSVIAIRRVVLAGVVLGLVAALARVHRSNAAELGLRQPSPREAGIAIGGGVALVVGGLVVGPLIARPFFGPLDFPVPPAALLPALVFGLANGTTEEVVYRGSLQGWLGRLSPAWLAVGYQGLVFGIVHAGPEVVALLPLHVALLATCGVGAGLIRRWTGSLAIPIGVHVGADIALYVGLACRSAG